MYLPAAINTCSCLESLHTTHAWPGDEYGLNCVLSIASLIAVSGPPREMVRLFCLCYQWECFENCFGAKESRRKTLLHGEHFERVFIPRASN